MAPVPDWARTTKISFTAAYPLIRARRGDVLSSIEYRKHAPRKLCRGSLVSEMSPERKPRSRTPNPLRWPCSLVPFGKRFKFCAMLTRCIRTGATITKSTPWRSWHCFRSLVASRAHRPVQARRADYRPDCAVLCCAVLCCAEQMRTFRFPKPSCAISW